MKTVRRGEIDEFVPGPSPYEIPIHPDDLIVDEETGVTTAVIAVPPPTPPEEAWRTRANEYNCRYNGPEMWCRFIRITAATGSLEFAMQQTGINRGILKRKRERYALFDEHLIAAQNHFKFAVLQRAAVTRAIDGTLEPVFHKGRIVGWIGRKSDALLAKLMEGLIPEVFKPKLETENTHTHRIIIEGGLPDDEPHGVTIEHDAGAGGTGNTPEISNPSCGPGTGLADESPVQSDPVRETLG